MLLPDGKGVLVEAPDRVDKAKFLASALAEFPNLAEEFAEDGGLFHLQMATLSRFAQAAIGRSDFVTLQRCYALLEGVAKRASDEVENAIYVSFLENLDFEDSPTGKEARRLLPPILGKMLLELEEHWRQINEWHVQAQESRRRAREEKKRRE